MNLKEAFRFQKRLNEFIETAIIYAGSVSYAYKTTHKHFVNKVNPDIEDFEEVTEPESFLCSIDNMAKIAIALIGEREKLSLAIVEAKRTAPIDIDVYTDLNKTRRLLSNKIKAISSHKPTIVKNVGYGTRFNVEGNQVQYRYDVEIHREDFFDREWCKSKVPELYDICEETSKQLELALLSTEVDYEPLFKINDKFEDVVASFL